MTLNSKKLYDILKLDKQGAYKQGAYFTILGLYGKFISNDAWKVMLKQGSYERCIEQGRDEKLCRKRQPDTLSSDIEVFEEVSRYVTCIEKNEDDPICETVESTKSSSFLGSRYFAPLL